MRHARTITLRSPGAGLLAAVLALTLLAGRSGAQETMPSPETRTGPETRGDEFVYTIPPEGIPLEVLAKDAEVATGRTFILSDKSPLRGKTIRLFGEARVAKDQVLQLFQALFVTQGYALKPLGDQRNRILVVESIDTAVDLKQRARFVSADELDAWRNEVGSVVMTFFPLRYVRLQNVRAAISQILTSKSVELAIDVESANALLVFGFAPTVYAIKQVISVMDVPQPEEDLEFALIGFKHGVAEEIEPIVRNLIESTAKAPPPQDASGRQKPQPKVVADPRMNVLAVCAARADVSEIRQIVGILDQDVRDPAQNIRVYRLKHTNAEDVAEVLRESLGTGSSRGGRGRGAGASGRGAGAEGISAGGPDGEVLIVAEPLNNALIIRASRSRYAEVLPLIETLDRKRPQVVIQAAVAEMTDDELRSIGAELAAFEGGDDRWRLGALTGYGLSDVQITSAGSITGQGPGSGTGTGGGGGGPGQHINQGNPSLIRIPTFAGNTLDGRGGVFGLFNEHLNVPILISLLQTGRHGNLVSTPLVLANDNTTSTIESGLLIPTVEFQAGQGNLQGDSTNFSGYQEAKVALTISPHVSNDDYVRLDVEVLVEAFLPSTDTRRTESRPSTPPDKTSRKLVGSVTVRNGATIIAGGLILDQGITDQRGVPGVANAPLIGPFFRARSRFAERSSIYFFLTPTIISSFETLDHVSYARKLEMLKLQGPVKIIDANFQPIRLDDRRVGIDGIEESGNLDMPRYEALSPIQECGPRSGPAQDAPGGSR